MKKYILVLVLLNFVQIGFSQVGINTTTPNAQLDIKSSNQVTPANTDGIIIPKIDAFPAVNPTASQQGMMVYLTTTSAGKVPGFYYWDNSITSWKGIDNDSGWSLTGNSGTNAANNFVGTTDFKPLNFRINNENAGRIDLWHSVYLGYQVGSGVANLGFSNTGIGAQALFSNTTGDDNTAIGAGTLYYNTGGIGNTAIGSGSIRGGSGSYNTASGYGTLALNTSGGSNNAFGTNALNKNTTGSNNVAIGSGALYENQTGSNAVAIGYGAMQNSNNTGAAFSNYNVAIGYQALKGSLTPANNTGYNNTAIGSLALSANTTGSQNTALGKSALAVNTTGNSNVALGSEALSDNTTGGNNVAIGYGALTSNTTGSFNQAFGKGLTLNTTGGYNLSIGFEALHNNDTASYNLAFGYQALFNNTTGNYNFAIGQTALRTNTTGGSNMAIGINALNKSTTSSFNLAIGSSALASNTTGSTNFAIGTAALGDNVTGNFCTAVGHYALRDNISGSNNTALGYGALVLNTDGNTNVAIGEYALRSNSTGDGNVVLGYQAGYSELGSNKLYIENSASATPLIYGEFDTDIVKVNGIVKVHKNAADTEEMQLNNTNIFGHNAGNQDFGSGQNEFILSSKEGVAETAGVYGDGNSVSIWSPGDGNQGQPAAIVYFLDEDSFEGTNTNPYDNSAVKSYVSAVGAYVQVSDATKKENITRIENSLEKVQKLNGYTYQFKQAKGEIEKGDKPVKCSGVLAQELEKVLPEAVQKSVNGDYYVDYAAITPLLIEAIKEQQKDIKQQETKINSLEERLAKLEMLLNKK